LLVATDRWSGKQRFACADPDECSVIESQAEDFARTIVDDRSIDHSVERH
jgi:hypothetical protein